MKRGRGNAFRAVGVIAGGTAIGQLAALAASPLLTRIYSPTDFGVLAAFSAIVAIVGTVAAGRLDLAVPTARDETDAEAIAGVGLLCCVATGVVCLMGVAFAGGELSEMLAVPGLQQSLWLMPGAASAMGAYLVLNQWAIRKARFSAIGKRNTVHGVTMASTQLGFGVAGMKPAGLPLGVLLAYAVSAGSLLWTSGLAFSRLRAEWRPSSALRTLRIHRRYPLVLGPAGLLNIAGLQLPILILAGGYGAEVAGWLGLTQRVLSLPVTLLGTAIAQVYLARMSAAYRSDEDIRDLFVRASRHLAAVGAIGAILLLAAGPALFEFAFGAAYGPSGDFARALALGFAGQLIGAPLSQTLIVLGHQFWQLAWDFGRAVVLCGGAFASVAAGASASEAVWILGLGTALTYAAAWLLSHRAVKKRQD